MIVLSKESISFLINRNIIIIGFMGSGKSFLGDILTRELKMPLIDTDKLIEQQQNKSIYDIFKDDGEMFFRKCEKRIIENIVFSYKENETNPSIIVTGGGTICPNLIRRLLKNINPFYICLNPPFETILSRIRGTQRPLIYKRKREYIFKLWANRYSLYQNTADIILTDIEIEKIMCNLNLKIPLVTKKGRR